MSHSVVIINPQSVKPLGGKTKSGLFLHKIGRVPIKVLWTCVGGLMLATTIKTRYSIKFFYDVYKCCMLLHHILPTSMHKTYTRKQC